MSRIRELQKKVRRELEDMKEKEKYAKAVSHLHGASFAAVMIARKRGENAELAAMAGLLHDLYAYRKGSFEDHARLGARYAEKLLKKMDLTTPEETEIICSAIRRHSDKAAVDSPLDEVLKDADVLHHSLDDPAREIKEQDRKRYAKLCAEFGMEDL